MYTYLYIYIYMWVCDLTHSHICHDSFMFVPKYMCVRTYIYVCIHTYAFIYTYYMYVYIYIYICMYMCVRLDSFTSVPWLIHVWTTICMSVHIYMYACIYIHVYICIYTYVYINKDMLVCASLDSLTSVPWLIHVRATHHFYVCDVPHPYVWLELFICVTRLFQCECACGRIHMCAMMHSDVRHDAYICVLWLIHMCDMTHSCVWHDSEATRSSMSCNMLQCCCSVVAMLLQCCCSVVADHRRQDRRRIGTSE